MLPLMPSLSWFPATSSNGYPAPTRAVTKSHHVCSWPTVAYDMSPSARVRSEPTEPILFSTAVVSVVDCEVTGCGEVHRPRLWRGLRPAPQHDEQRDEQQHGQGDMALHG